MTLPTPSAEAAQSLPAPLPVRGTTSLLSRGFVWLCGVWLAFTTVILFLLQQTTTDPVGRAIARMALGLVILWIIGGGTLSLLFRRLARRWLQRYARHWRIVFVLGATGMALLEEAITTTMTNLAPLFGDATRTAHITASANYLDVVLLHSVVVFVPLFIAWSWLLARYDFSPSAVFILFGVAGTLAESLSFGLQNLAQGGFWIYVYGLMVFLPAYAVPPPRSARQPHIGAVLLAIFLPILAAIPVALAVQAVHSAFFVRLP